MKGHKESHASSSKKMKTGEYGIGFKNPVGKMISIMGETKMQPKKMKKPPRKMA